MKLIIMLLTLLFGKKAGQDEFKNHYYYSRIKLFGRNRRWVVFHGDSEPSKIPNNWEAWLRHMVAEPLNEKKQYNWQKKHIPNLTGTSKKFNPKEFNKNIKTYNKYKAWDENQ
ncbi:NADH:ubiquinone oxidoreductase subunit NDUFA12 [Candidatus Hepatincolaceae symbiont of Richtersius coronifer]